MQLMSDYDPQLLCVLFAIVAAGLCLLLAGIHLWRHEVKKIVVSLLCACALGLAVWFFVNSKGLLAPSSYIAWFLTVVSHNTALAAFTIVLKSLFGFGQGGAHASSTLG
ncbi:hypothetical protein HGB25_01810 [Candidatus Saccharibacteria bacterium]|nr:hypothetical protein [Candidatus Saccharibacteria bacterium]